MVVVVVTVMVILQGHCIVVKNVSMVLVKMHWARFSSFVKVRNGFCNNKNSSKSNNRGRGGGGGGMERGRLLKLAAFQTLWSN